VGLRRRRGAGGKGGYHASIHDDYSSHEANAYEDLAEEIYRNAEKVDRRRNEMIKRAFDDAFEMESQIREEWADSHDGSSNDPSGELFGAIPESRKKIISGVLTGPEQARAERSIATNTLKTQRYWADQAKIFGAPKQTNISWHKLGKKTQVADGRPARVEVPMPTKAAEENRQNLVVNSAWKPPTDYARAAHDNKVSDAMEALALAAEKDGANMKEIWAAAISAAESMDTYGRVLQAAVVEVVAAPVTTTSTQAHQNLSDLEAMFPRLASSFQGAQKSLQDASGRTLKAAEENLAFVHAWDDVDGDDNDRMFRDDVMDVIYPPGSDLRRSADRALREIDLKARAKQSKPAWK
jgi:hypothetical protein